MDNTLSHGDRVNQSPDNPPDNKLPSGFRLERITDAVRHSGYPLQTVVAQALLPRFKVIEEWGYSDRDTQDHRSLDLFTSYTITKRPGSQLTPTLALLIECKRSALPYLFFSAAVPDTPREFPAVLGLPDDYELHAPGGTRYISPSAFLRLDDFRFVNAGPPLCNALAKSAGERKQQTLKLSGAVPFKTAILPLISALEHLRRLYTPAQPPYAPCVTLCICVLDAPMILAEGTPEDPQLTLSPWIRVVRGEAVQVERWFRYRHYVVDLVQRHFLAAFLSQHLLPFADSFSDRVLQGEPLVLGRKGRVPDANNWRWDDLKAVP